MYISRMPLNTARVESRRLLASPYRLHAAVEHAFPPVAGREGDEGRILWRLDVPSTGPGSAWLYVVSPAKPDFTHLVEQAGWPAAYAGAWETKDYTPLLERIAAGQRWQFRLKANPARKVARDQGRMPDDRVVGTVRGHVTVAQQVTWLLDRAEAHGFAVCEGEGSVPAVSVSQRHKEEFLRGERRVTIATAVFDGLLEVRDPAMFRRALCWGIGRAKGFGCGLMTVAPPGAGA